MLGHLDTVPTDGRSSGTTAPSPAGGCVDAKGSLVAYLETLHDLDVPPDTQVEEWSARSRRITSAGAFFVRDHYKADAVIIGEPSGARAR